MVYAQDQLDFLEACCIGDEHRVLELLSTDKIDPEYQHHLNGRSALHWAACRGHRGVCEVLIRAGWSLEARDTEGRRPAEIVSPKEQRLRAFFKSFEPAGYREDEEMLSDSSGVSSPHSSSCTPSDSPVFVPAYKRHPPFPYATKSQSFDFGSTGRRFSGPAQQFSYGRRDSFSRTRFLLVRTSYGHGKEAFTRVTLPGGSDVEALKRTIEKAMKMGRVVQVLTLPQKELVEEDEQVAAFADCQKIDVIFDDGTPTPEPVGDVQTKNGSERRNSSPTKSKLQKRKLKKAQTTDMSTIETEEKAPSEDKEIVVEASYAGEPSTIEIPVENVTSTTADVGEEEEEEEEEEPEAPAAVQHDDSNGEYEKVDESETKDIDLQPTIVEDKEEEKPAEPVKEASPVVTVPVVIPVAVEEKKPEPPAAVPDSTTVEAKPKEVEVPKETPTVTPSAPAATPAATPDAKVPTTKPASPKSLKDVAKKILEEHPQAVTVGAVLAVGAVGYIVYKKIK